jgi:hypothetical protein
VSRRRRRRRHPRALPLWLTPTPKRGRAGHGRCCDAPRGHPAHPCRPRTPLATAAISSRRRDPHGSPNPSRLGGFNPLPPTRKPEEKEKGKRRRRTEAPGAAPPAAKPEPPERRSRTRGSQARLRPPASSTSSSSRRFFASPTSAASFLVTAPHTPSPTPALRPVATQVRTLFLLPYGRHGPRAEAERPWHRAAAPPLVMPVIEPRWDAIFCRCRRLRRRARHPPSLPL